jgi:DNA gyrase/topoisomerase IV subunit A
MFTLSENGFGKISKLSEFTIQKRGGTGIFAARVNKKTLLSHHSLSSMLQQIYQFNLLFKRLSLQSKLI